MKQVTWGEFFTIVSISLIVLGIAMAVVIWMSVFTIPAVLVASGVFFAIIAFVAESEVDKK